MKYEFHPEALDEFEEAIDFYFKRQRGLETRFISAVHTAIKTACNSLERWRQFDGDIRRVLVRVFPYAVLYSIEDEYISIIAVMHSSREPGYWKSRKQ